MKSSANSRLVSGLLELADREFREIRDKSLAYRARVSEELKRSQISQIELDSISFGEYLATSSIVRDLDAHLRDDLGYQIRSDTDQGRVLQMLKYVGITTVEELERALTANVEPLKRYASTLFPKRLEKEGDRRLRSGLSVFHLPQLLLARKGTEELAKLFALTALGPPGEEKTHAQYVVNRVHAIDHDIPGPISAGRRGRARSKRPTAPSRKK